jgi:hypothetical protein
MTIQTTANDNQNQAVAAGVEEVTPELGELGLCGVGAAIANAIYNATGVRVRDYPITPDKLIA